MTSAQPSASRSLRPLTGRRVVVTRPAGDDGRLSARLRALGAAVIVAPGIRIEFESPNVMTPLDGCLADLADYDWLVLTSANALRAVLERPTWIAPTDRPRIAAVGPATAAACRLAGLEVALTSDGGTAGQLVEQLCAAGGPPRGSGLPIGSNPVVAAPCGLFPRANIARPELAAGLRAAGWRVDDVEAYRTVIDAPAAEGVAEIVAGIDAVTFASPSAVRALVDGLNGAARRALGAAAIVCIGPTTAAAAEAAGLTVAAVASRRSDEGLAGAVADWFSQAEGVDRRAKGST